MSNTKQFTKGSEIKEALLEVPGWQKMIEEEIVDLEMVQKYLLEYPEHFDKVIKIVDWLPVEDEEKHNRGCIAFLTSYEAGTQRNDNAVLEMFGCAGFCLESPNIERRTEFTSKVTRYLEGLAIDGVADNFSNPKVYIFAWMQIREALLEVTNFDSPLEQFNHAISKREVKCDDPKVLEYLIDMLDKYAVYSSLLPWDSEELHMVMREDGFRKKK